ncbi:hypothetical protein CYMTET_26938 [Cymbomonas tetramitiformis]|uniref:Glycosyltransferase family 28 N-terminal domain-containing protein n=1 Tax=Cymbomonas tetramitiformis TaxID=36881 RepID=A0AAE0KXF0_9CHLO|nr:hypothetical protein CYMTET_26938 [Cymbomonas tetramitiformis]
MAPFHAYKLFCFMVLSFMWAFLNLGIIIWVQDDFLTILDNVLVMGYFQLAYTVIAWLFYKQVTSCLAQDDATTFTSPTVYRYSARRKLRRGAIDIDMSPSRRFIPHTGVLCATAPDEEQTLRLVPSETSPSISPPLSLSFPMNICIMVVGTHGDVLPFIALGRRLREEGGHRVRLASHKHHEDLVKRNGLEYYPLGGDPKQLSEWMVQSKGSLLPLNLKALEAAPLKLQMINEILFSTWPACTAADPAPNDCHGPFLAHAIISNPVTYGHIHCAQALGVPLHLMFPQPWTPTCAFPHPLAREIRFSQNRYVNWQSYFAVDDYMFMGTMKITNRFRVRIGLGRLRVGQRGAHLLNSFRVPFAKMWSPALVSKPSDWPPEVDVVGSFSLNQPSFYSPDPKLVEWLEAGEKPIYVGFGSMVLGDPEAVLALREIIVEASRESNARVLIQSNWTDLGGASLPEHVYSLGPAPHDWLFPRMAAVVHHGGAGTVAAGLRYGKPTMVCPFFGDQFFWGERVYNAGVGPRPCPVEELTVGCLAGAFLDLLRQDRILRNTASLAAVMEREDGVEGGLQAFYNHLPKHDMVCDVSLFLADQAAADVYHVMNKIKVSYEVHVVMGIPGFDYTPMDWSLSPQNPLEAIGEAVFIFLHEVVAAFAGLLMCFCASPHTNDLDGDYKWWEYTREKTMEAWRSVVKALTNLLLRPLKGVLVLVHTIYSLLCCGLCCPMIISPLGMLPSPWAHMRLKLAKRCVRRPHPPVSGDRRREIAIAYNTCARIRCQFALHEGQQSRRISAAQARKLLKALQLHPPHDRVQVDPQEDMRWYMGRLRTRYFTSFFGCAAPPLVHPGVLEAIEMINQSDKRERLAKTPLGACSPSSQATISFEDFCLIFRRCCMEHDKDEYIAPDDVGTSGCAPLPASMSCMEPPKPQTI